MLAIACLSGASRGEADGASCADALATGSAALLRRQGSQPWGVRSLPDSERIPAQSMISMVAFVESGVWLQSDSWANERDKADPLCTAGGGGSAFPFRGAFMMGFDFHLTADGPRLIEVNTNAGGFATVIEQSSTQERARLCDAFAAAVVREFSSAGANPPRLVAIVDDDCEQQRLFPEMRFLASVLCSHGIPAEVCSPERLAFDRQRCKLMLDDGREVDLVYNRLAPDFRLDEPRHAELRAASLAGAVVLTPHPSVYVHAADKRLLGQLAATNPIVPLSFPLTAKSKAEWWADRQRWVFKPASGNGSR